MLKLSLSALFLAFVVIVNGNAMDIVEGKKEGFIEPQGSFTPHVPSQYCNIDLISYDQVFNTKNPPNRQYNLEKYLDVPVFVGTLCSKLKDFYWGDSFNLQNLVPMFALTRQPGSRSSAQFYSDPVFQVAHELGVLDRPGEYSQYFPNLILQNYNYMGLTRQMIADLGYKTAVKTLENGKEVLVFCEDQQDNFPKKMNSKATSFLSQALEILW